MVVMAAMVIMMVQLNAMTRTGGVILGPMQDSAEGGIEHGWEKTAKNPAICVAMAEIARTRKEAAIIGPTEDSVKDVMQDGWEKTVKNLVLCAKLDYQSGCLILVPFCYNLAKIDNIFASFSPPSGDIRLLSCASASKFYSLALASQLQNFQIT